ncbi:MAG: C25 family cysteine peptidase, partial [Saprospiraceae bacterium]|nr:C25 family cysteine peptidase [Saprospiraceae bacterium]
NFGKKNTSELDRHLFRQPDSMMMNPHYSLVTDTAAYFLTWANAGNNLRYATLANNLTNLPPKEAYYLHEQLYNYTDVTAKYTIGQSVTSSSYDQAEGFSTPYAITRSFALSPTSVYSSGPDAKLTLRFSGNAGPHQQAITLNGQPLLTSEFEHFEVRQEVVDLPIGQVTPTMEIKFQGLFSSTDRQRVSNIILEYPRQFDFENKASFAFKIAAATMVKYLEISNFDLTNGQPVLYDLTNLWRMQGVAEAGVVKFAVPASTTSRSLVLVSESAGANVVNLLQPAPFVDFKNLDHDFILLTGRQLLNSGVGQNQIQAYADYRASQAGGSYSPIVVEAEQLYDQFSWGIERHPLSVRNFAVFVKKHWDTPRYFFIIGKGREYPDVRTSPGLQAALDLGFYVPTYSFPGSDNMLLAGNDGFTPVIPIGRIAATTQADVQVYLQKVKELEAQKDLPQTIADRAWMKRVLHMGSGKDPAEQNQIKSYLKNLETSIEQSKFGGEVQSFYKTSTDPIQVSVTQQLFDFINGGTSMITFFGHSAVNTFDFSIDNPDNFSNKGKYPLILSLGCYSGNIHTPTIGISERFCFLKDKGAIAFGSTSGLGFAGPLSSFSGEFYKNIGEETYGQGIGDAVQDAIAAIPSGQFASDIMRQQFNLHGDPSIRLNPAPGPDFLVDAASVKLNPGQITTQMTEFDLSFEVVNIGSSLQDSIVVSVVHQLPDGSQVAPQELLIPAPALRQSLTMRMPTLGALAKGYNQFFIKVDKTDRVEELPQPFAEQNNELVTGSGPGIGIYFLDNSVEAVYPTEFSIVGNGSVELIASTTDPLMPERSYIFQIDTTELFNSPQLLVFKTIKPGGLIKWKPSINWQNERVYYWRISPDSLSQTDAYIWDNSSFIYLNGTESGWNQSHFYQWKKDAFKDMELKTHGNLKFIDNFKDVFVKNAVNSVSAIDLQINNNFAGRFWYNMDAGIYAMVFDSTTASEWQNLPPYPYGVPLNIGGFPVPNYTFETQTQAGRQQLVEFLRDVVPAKNFVVLHTVQANPGSDYKPQDWEADQPALGTDLFQILEAEGASLIRNTLTTGAVPYVFAYQKGVGPLKEVLADSLTQVLTVTVGVPGYWDEGAVLSTPIGPAAQWNKLVWQVEPATNPETDTISVDVLAHDPVTLTDSVLVANVQPGELDLSGFSTTEHPVLRLRYNAKDSIFRTSPQLVHWRVLYQGVPDFAVNPNGGYELRGDTVQQGEPLRLECLVENLANFPGDSLLIKYAIRAENNAETVVLKRERTFAAQDSLRTVLVLDTKQLSGKYSLLMELNPSYEQPEQTSVNNVLATAFFVTKDARNPLLDVTFDGVHIMDGDLVAAKPQIRIALEDENAFLKLNDTALFRLYIALPDTSAALFPIYFNDPRLVFYPAQNSSKNRAFIEFNPVFDRDGSYKLIVQSRDVSGNQAGRFDYKIGFNIITKSSISNFLNYPNPFTTSTRFVYTMTGAEPPPRFKLQIMTVTGRLVRELTEADLGPLKIGSHQTEMAWDGTDEFGDSLAKGVYLYRMVAQDSSGKDWDGFDTKADNYFKKGFGKMVILR